MQQLYSDPSVTVSNGRPLFRVFAAVRSNVSRLVITDVVCFSVRPLTDHNLVEQLAVCGTCVYPLVWRASGHNTASLSISRIRPYKRQSGPADGCVAAELEASDVWPEQGLVRGQLGSAGAVASGRQVSCNSWLLCCMKRIVTYNHRTCTPPGSMGHRRQATH